MRRALAIAFALAGCLAPSSAGGGQGIFGVATIGPACPVERDPPDPACADRPYNGTLAVTSADGARTVTTFAPDAQGRFNVSLPAGEYAIRATAQHLPTCSSAGGPVVVSAERWTLVNVACDSGIR